MTGGTSVSDASCDNKGVNAFKNAQYPEAVEHFKQDILQVLMGVMDMPLDGVADLLAIGAGEKDADAVGQRIIDGVGLSSGYVVLKTEKYPAGEVRGPVVPGR